MDKLSTIVLLAGYSNQSAQAITDALSGHVKSITKSVLDLRAMAHISLVSRLEDNRSLDTSSEFLELPKHEEIARVREELELSKKSMDQELESMRQAFDTAMVNNEKLARRLDAYKTQVTKLSEENERIRGDMQTEVRHAEKWRNRAGSAEAEKNQIQEALAGMEVLKDRYLESTRQARNEANSAIRELQALQRTHTETTALLEARIPKLTFARQFLTDSDSIPSEVTKLSLCNAPHEYQISKLRHELKYRDDQILQLQGQIQAKV